MKSSLVGMDSFLTCREIFNKRPELAMEIIETVVAGPECDSLWAVWHKPEVTDDEELEAWTIQID